jgi:hypothetical protein
MPYVKKHNEPIIKYCIYCGDPVEFKHSGWKVKYPVCDKAKCQEAKKAAQQERSRQAVKAVYAKHGGAGKYRAKTHTIHEDDELVLPKPVDPPPKCITPGCKNKAHRAYDGVIQYAHCKRCLQKLNARARAVEAAWFPEAFMYY